MTKFVDELPANERPKGKTMRELRAILAAEDDRRDALLEAFGDLLEEEQLELIRWAEELARGKGRS